jgi:hypothetical protein
MDVTQTAWETLAAYGKDFANFEEIIELQEQAKVERAAANSTKFTKSYDRN